MAEPTQKELEFQVDEIGWSLISMCRHLLYSKVDDRDDHPARAQAAFDGAVLHARAILEFLAETRGGHIKAEHYCESWNGNTAADARNLDLTSLKDDLNIHAAHLSRCRFKVEPEHEWDLARRVSDLLDLFGDLIDCPDVACRQPLYEQLSEARVQLVRANEI